MKRENPKRHKVVLFKDEDGEISGAASDLPRGSMVIVVPCYCGTKLDWLHYQQFRFHHPIVIVKRSSPDSDYAKFLVLRDDGYDSHVATIQGQFSSEELAQYLRDLGFTNVKIDEDREVDYDD